MEDIKTSLCFAVWKIRWAGHAIGWKLAGGADIDAVGDACREECQAGVLGRIIIIDCTIVRAWLQVFESELNIVFIAVLRILENLASRLDLDKKVFIVWLHIHYF